MLIILCVLIFYIGIYLRIDISKSEVTLRISESLIEHMQKNIFTSLYYKENEKSKTENWFISSALHMLPILEYWGRTESEEDLIQTEDEDTYEMIMALQANDEDKMTEEKEEKSVLLDVSKDRLSDSEYLISNFYTVDSSTSVPEGVLDTEKLLKKKMTLNKNTQGPKVLIYHTHSQEAFSNSKKGETNDTIMGMGAYLTELLNEKYEIETIHHKGVYDLINGQLDRSKAYELAEAEIRKELEKHPSIEVVIDLHRDGVKESTHLVTEIDGKQTAQIMFFNGLSRTRANGDIKYLYNPYIEDNLAFSLQMQLKAMEKYPGFTRRIYLKSYRYNMHLMPKTLLIEAGAQTNTVSEMKHAMEVLAEILHDVLTE